MTVAARQEGWRLVTSDGDPAIDLQPLQGLWTEAQYLRLTGQAASSGTQHTTGNRPGPLTGRTRG